MGRKAKNGINKSQMVRDIFAKNPDIKVKDLVAELASQDIHVAPNLVYLIKGKIKGSTGRRRRNTRAAVSVATTSGSGDALATVIKVKRLAADVGGLRTLKALVDALSE